MENVEKLLDRFLRPLAEVLQKSDSMQAISEGFIRTTPITLGICALTIIGNFPVESFITWLTEIGIKPYFDAVLSASTGVLGLYVSFTIGHAYAKRKGSEPLTCGLLCLMSFIMLIPHTVEGAQGKQISAFSLSYLSGTAILVALIVSLVVAHIYHLLDKRGLKLKMPRSVPPMVAESLEPMFTATIIVCFAFFVRVAFGFSPFGNAVDCFQQTIGGVIMRFGTSPAAIIALYSLATLVWFFGIHPATITGAYDPILMTMTVTSISEFSAGKPLTYLFPLVLYACVFFGGAGNTIGLCLAMTTAKSQRYKQMCKIALIPNFFNINEPVIFGTPVMLNPVFFLPMVLNPVLLGVTAEVYLKIVPFSFNPSAGFLPWTTPFPISMFVSGGLALLILAILLLAVNTLVYYPFFRIADNRALSEELEEKEHEHVAAPSV